ncbi:hypothetical protein cypCar_00019503 [Cyprinus carpio]|nr:hypothetical protein cypCar_00019503 [Cyprinus carpio]
MWCDSGTPCQSMSSAGVQASLNEFYRGGSVYFNSGCGKISSCLNVLQGMCSLTGAVVTAPSCCVNMNAACTCKGSTISRTALEKPDCIRCVACIRLF